MPGNREWRAKRKVISAAFYKDKLLQMIELIKIEVDAHMKEWPAEGTIDIMQSLADL
jgi:cytochrome P450